MQVQFNPSPFSGRKTPDEIWADHLFDPPTTSSAGQNKKECAAAKTDATGKEELQKKSKEVKIQNGPAKSWTRFVNPETEETTHSPEKEAEGVLIKAAKRSPAPRTSTIERITLLSYVTFAAGFFCSLFSPPDLMVGTTLAAMTIVPLLVEKDNIKRELAAKPEVKELSTNQEVVEGRKAIEAAPVKVKSEKAIPNQKHNPHLHLAVKEFVRFFAPTIGEVAGVLETTANKFWTSYSGLTGRKEMASRPERIKQTGGSPFEPRLLEILDNGLATGLGEAAIQTVKPKVLKALKDGEKHLYSVFNKNGNTEVASVTPLVDGVANPSFFKKVTQKVIGIATTIFSFISKISTIIGRIFAKVEVVKDSRTDEQKKTDEAMHDFIHRPIKQFLKQLPIISRIGKKVGDKVIDILAIRLRLFRNYLLGEQNQERVSRLFDNIVDNVLNAFGTRLQCINSHYYSSFGILSKIAESLGAERKDEAFITSVKDTELINQVTKEFGPHPAMITLTEDEKFIYANSEAIKKDFEQVLQRQVKCDENLRHWKRTGGHKGLIEALEKRIFRVKSKE